jgi:hypothetical protein
MLKAYEFKYNVKDDHIMRQKPQISTLLVVELILYGAHHGTVVLTRKCALYQLFLFIEGVSVKVSGSSDEFIRITIASEIHISRALNGCILTCEDYNVFSATQHHW